MDHQQGVSTSAMPAAPYSLRPPSPPYIHVPSALSTGQSSIELVPSYENVDSSTLTHDDLYIVTKSRTQVATDASANWAYESRRQAQPILDFLYLGPSSVARDHKWLRDEGITLILVARHSSVAMARLMSVDKAAQALGISAEYVDVSGYNELIRAFPEIVGRINDHLLSIYRSQAMDVPDNVPGGKMVIDQRNFRKGKVLVCCETGNDRSATVVAAYIMSVFARDMVSTLQFISIQRFCCNFDEEIKRILQSWEDILQARRNVSQAQRDASPFPPPAQGAALRSGGKRGIEDTLDDEDMEMGEGYSSFALDRDRYMDRDKFAPFVDVKDDMTPG